MFSVNDKRAMNNGFGDGMSRAFELAITPLVFGGLGFVLDRAIGTSPVFAVAFAAFAVIGMFVRVWFGYDLEMRQLESTSRWGADRVVPEPEPVADLWAAARDEEASA